MQTCNEYLGLLSLIIELPLGLQVFFEKIRKKRMIITYFDLFFGLEKKLNNILRIVKSDHNFSSGEIFC